MPPPLVRPIDDALLQRAVEQIFHNVLAATAVFVVLFHVGVAVYLVGSHVHFRRYIRHKGMAPPLTGRQLLRWFVDEYLGVVAIFWFGLFRFSDGVRIGQSVNRGVPVICIHGYTQNGGNFRAIRRRLEKSGRPTCAPNLGRPFQPMERYVAVLTSVIEEMRDRHPEGQQFDVVAHSMGGLVLRLLLQQREDLRHMVRVVVTLGSPHRGTAAARFVIVGDDARAMRRRASFLTSLPTLDVLVPTARLVSIIARQDYVVYPPTTSHIDGGENITLERPGHVGLLIRPEAVDLVVDVVTSLSDANTIG